MGGMGAMGGMTFEVRATSMFPIARITPMTPISHYSHFVKTVHLPETVHREEFGRGKAAFRRLRGRD